jgi:hypothetical protein
MFFQSHHQNPYNNHNYQVPNPSSPYNGDIPNGLVPGKQIQISGVVGHHADRLQFNLLTHSGGHALHINPRFDQNCVVRNSCIGGWGQEERHGNMVFQKGQPFNLIISCEPDRYRVAFNGQHLFDYNHRVPIQEVSRLSIEGQQQITSIAFNGGQQQRGHEISNPGVPFSMPISDGAQPGRLIQMKLVPQHGRFVINMQNGSAPNGSNDIVFHCSVRWDDPNSGGQPVVIRTNCAGGGWGQEERNQQFFPFQIGQEAEVLILLEPSEWKMAVNGQHFCSFAHRSPYYGATHLNINGSVQIRSIRQF